MTKTMIELEQISGIFKDRANIEMLLADLEARGFSSENVNVLMSDTTGNQLFNVKTQTKASEATAIGGLSGGLIGALVGGLTLVGTVLAPGVGLLVAGPVVGALTGGTIGVAAGGVIGGLIGMGIPEHEALFYEDALKEEGNALIVVQVAKEEVKETKALFERYGARDLKVKH